MPMCGRGAAKTIPMMKVAQRRRCWNMIAEKVGWWILVGEVVAKARESIVVLRRSKSVQGPRQKFMFGGNQAIQTSASKCLRSGLYQTRYCVNAIARCGVCAFVGTCRCRYCEGKACTAQVRVSRTFRKNWRWMLISGMLIQMERVRDRNN